MANSIDDHLCRDVAELWKSYGGDADGFRYCWGRVVEILEAWEEEEDE